MDPAIRHEALRHNPTTLAEWKNAARNAFRIISEQRRYQSNRNIRTPKSNKFKGKAKKFPNPRYTNIHTQPITHGNRYQRNEYDMDIDRLMESIDEIDLDYSEEEIDGYESEDSEDLEEIEEEDIFNIINSSGKRKSKEHNALSHVVYNVLTDEQRNALRNGECFFCHKKGHFFRDCKDRKVYLNSRGKKPMGNGKGPRRNSKTFQKKSKPMKKFKSKRTDPNAMVYELEDDSNSDSDGNF